MPSPPSTTNQRNLTRALKAAALIVALLLLCQVALQLYTRGMRADARQNLALERALNELYDSVKDAETSQRGYILTSSSKHLKSFNDARTRASASTQKINSQRALKGLEADQFARLTLLIDRKFAELRATFQQDDPARVFGTVLSSEGEALMIDIRTISDRLRAAWMERADQLQERIDKLFSFINGLIVVSTLALLVIVYYLFSRFSPLMAQLADMVKKRDAEIQQRIQIDTNRKKLIKQLEEKNQQLDHFAYIASHDLQEPLRTVNNFVQLIEEEHSEQIGEDGKVYFDFINEATDRMRLMIDQLLRFSQIGRKGELEEVDLNQSALAAVQNLAAAIEQGHADVQVSDLPIVTGYAIELIQLFQNLIGNAIKFTPPERTPIIRISCTSDEYYHSVHVSDNAMGIDENTQVKIFKMFSRVHASKDYEGYGIGLTFCRRIVEMHGGELTLTSTPGVGSIFSFTLAKNQHEAKAKKDSVD